MLTIQNGRPNVASWRQREGLAIVDGEVNVSIATLYELEYRGFQGAVINLANEVLASVSCYYELARVRISELDAESST